MLHAFCIDLEEWFHICGVRTPYDDPSSWDEALPFVESDTQVILDLLADAGAKATFLTVGWIADKYPGLIEKIVDAGHEIGCHTYYHRLLYTLSPDELREDLERCVEVLRRRSGQPVCAFRAPGFSIKPECYWVYPILREYGLTVDVSIVPAARDHGGIDGFVRDPFTLRTDAGAIKVFPVSVVNVAGKTVPFSGGGYLRLFPLSLMHLGFRQNIAANRPCMIYIHPRETNVGQPRLKLPRIKYFKYYVGLKSTKDKLAALLNSYKFGTISNVLETVSDWPEYKLENGNIESLRLS
jgi:polysaccharide deacetylase family protein (PEP-CTERM system associated)